MMLILRRIRAHSQSPAYGAGGQDTIALPAHAEMPLVSVPCRAHVRGKEHGAYASN